MSVVTGDAREGRLAERVGDEASAALLAASLVTPSDGEHDGALACSVHRLDLIIPSPDAVCDPSCSPI